MGKMTEAQMTALQLIAKQGPLKRGFFSGWGPHKYGYGAHRIDVGEATANRLISLGLIERWDVEDSPCESTIRITPAGRSALEQEKRG